MNTNNSVGVNNNNNNNIVHTRRSSTTSASSTTASTTINKSKVNTSPLGNKVVSPMSSPTSLEKGATPTIAQLQNLVKQQKKQPLNSSIDDLKSQLQHTNIEFSSEPQGEEIEEVITDEVIINYDYNSSDEEDYEDEEEEDYDHNNNNSNSVNNNISISSTTSCESIAEEEELCTSSPIQQSPHQRHYSYTMGTKLESVITLGGGFVSPRSMRSETVVVEEDSDDDDVGGGRESDKVVNAKDKISSDYKKMMEDLEGFRNEKLKQRKSKFFSKKELEEIPFNPSSGTQLRSTLFRQFMGEKMKMISENPEKYKSELMKCYKENLKPAPKSPQGSLSSHTDKLKALPRNRSISQPPVVNGSGFNSNGNNSNGNNIGSNNNNIGNNKLPIGTLESIIEREKKRDGNIDRKLPILVIKCIEFLSNEEALKTEGLFRVAGNSSEVEDLMKSILLYGSNIPHNCCFHVISNMLKKFLRQLSIPVFTYKYHNEFIQTTKLSNDEERVKSIKETLKLIPVVNQILIKELIKFLVKVTVFSNVNMMHAHNLGLMFGPNMLKSPPDSSEMNAMSTLDSGNQIITLLIENYGSVYDDNDDQQ